MLSPISAIGHRLLRPIPDQVICYVTRRIHPLPIHQGCYSRMICAVFRSVSNSQWLQLFAFRPFAANCSDDQQNETTKLHST
ncbi:unnamed protein product [Victoria cruziana]